MSSSLFTHQRAAFNNQFRSHFGDGFQDWFAKLARHLHPNGDVQPVRLTQGDGKLDVVALNEQLVYQCYGPQEFKPSVAAAKIAANFWGAHHHLDGRLQKWIFVHNHSTGALDKSCIKTLNDIIDECRKRGESIEVEGWGIENLWEALVERVSFHGLQELFGSPDPVVVDFSCLEEMLLSLERAPYPEDAERLPLPSQQKLDFNGLPPAYQREIREGRCGLRIMNDYLASRAASDPEFAERLAQRFRVRYAHWKSRKILSPDEIYENLRLDAGWKASRDIKREMASRTVLAYFFESCDIFENQPASS